VNKKHIQTNERLGNTLFGLVYKQFSDQVSSRVRLLLDSKIWIEVGEHLEISVKEQLSDQ
jgi:hypothetical protein